MHQNAQIRHQEIHKISILIVFDSIELIKLKPLKNILYQIWSTKLLELTPLMIFSYP